MAERKNKSGAKRSAPVKTADVKNKPRTAKKQTETAAAAPPSFMSQCLPYFFGVLAVLLAFFLFFPDASGKVGGAIHTVFSGLFSGAAYTIPFFLIYHAIFWKADDRDNILARKLICSALMLLSLSALVHVFTGYSDTLSAKVLWADGIDRTGGGLAGGFIGTLMLRGFGFAGSLIILFALIFFFALAMCGITPLTLFTWVRYKIKLAVDAKREAAAIEGANQPLDVNLPKGYVAENVRKNAAAKFQAKKQIDVPTEAKRNPPEKYVVSDIRRIPRRRGIDPTVLSDDFTAAPPESSPELSQDELNMIDAKIYGGSGAAEPVEVVAADEDIFDEALAEDKLSGETAYDPTSPEDGTETVKAEQLPANKTLKADDASKPGDLRAIFANPEDAAMLERISGTGSISGEGGIAGEVHRDEIISGEGEDADDGFPDTEISVSRRVITELPVKPEPVREYKFPPVELLTRDEKAIADKDAVAAELKDNAVKLVDTLRSFNVRTKIVDVSRGPTITRYELRPEEGTRVKAISNLVDDIALNLATTGVRIEAPIPGKSAVGIEVPNKTSATVYVRELIDTDVFRSASSKLTACLGDDVAGAPIIFDIAKMPHLLIAGTTGSGKSVCLNSILVSLLYKAKPEEVRLILIDPKKVEMNIYNGIPHLLVPVVSDPKKAAGALSWAVNEMERRYELIEEVGARNIKGYNEAVKDDPERDFLPQIVIIIDELADLMLTARDEVETSICRIAQKARAAGMHLIIGTQRPSVDVITGLIKANIPSRIAFTTVSVVDSRTIIDIGGAEKLIGRGDMLYMPVSVTKPLRTQGAFVSEDEVEAVVSYIRENNSEAVYADDVMDEIEREAEKCGVKKGRGGAATASKDAESGEYVIDDSYDPMFKPALEIVVDNGTASVSFIQRRLSIGYQRAARLVDKMQAMGYVAPARGQKPREVLLTKQMYMEMVLKNEIE